MRIIKFSALVAACCGVFSLTALAGAQPFWTQYGMNAQHAAASPRPVQALNAILWQTPVDINPVNGGGGNAVFAHYGSPLITQSGTVVVNVRTGPNDNYPSQNDTYRVEGHDLGTGVIKWSIDSDYVDWMPHDWTPVFGSAMDSKGAVYYPGGGGTIWKRSSADATSATLTHLSFYGLSTYQSNQVNFDSNIQVCTPLAIDANDNVYFGFYVASGFNNSLGLTSGIAKISPTGVGTWAAVDSITGDAGDEIATNCTPAITTDGKYLYEVAKQAQGYKNPKIMRLNTSDLTPVNVTLLTSPPTTDGQSTFPYVLDSGTASPAIGPDGDVYFGIWWSNLESRGFMLHYSADLQTVKPAGAFGWDDTASIVPSSAVPGYKGTSKYLILTKYNNYSDAGLTPEPGDGLNRVALLDPNATETYTVQYDDGSTGPSYVTMKEVQSVVGPTPNTGQPGVREWCINMAAIDIPGKAAVVNSEDGHCYRWDFRTNTLTQGLNLEPPTGEAYTPTVVSYDGISFAINNAELFAMWDGAKPRAITVGSNTISGGGTTQATLQLTVPTTGSGAVIRLASNNANVTVPSLVYIGPGLSSATFNISVKTVNNNQTATITAKRYGYAASLALNLQSSELYALAVRSNVLTGGGSPVQGDVALAGPAPQSGRTIKMTSTISGVSFSPQTFTIPYQYNVAYFTFQATAVPANQAGSITAWLDDGTSLTTPIKVIGPSFSGFSLAQGDVIGGNSDTGTVSIQGNVPSSGVKVNMTYSAHTSGPATVSVGTSGTANFTVNTSAVTASSSEVVYATFNGVTISAPIIVSPQATLSGFTLWSATYMGYSVSGTVTLSAPASGDTTVLAQSQDGYSFVPSNPTVAKGTKSAKFTVNTANLSKNTSVTSTVTVSLGSTSISKTITIYPITVASLSLSSSSVKAGSSTTLTINTTQPAGGTTTAVLLGSNSSYLTVPSSAYVPSGQKTFTVTLKAASSVPANTPVTVSVTLAGVTKTINLTVTP